MQTHAVKNHGTPCNADRKRQRGGESTLHIVSNRPEAIAQRKLQEMANDSPQVQRLKAAQDMADASPQVRQAMVWVAQSKPFGSKSGKTAQLDIAPEEEELLQGKFQTLQRQGPEEEELLQGKFNPIQRMGPEEEEEPLQGKFQTLQRQSLEEEEPLQGKFDSIQRMEPEEEELQMKQGVRSESAAQLEADPAPRSNDTGLPDNLKSGIESLSGMSMDNVKVHYNSAQPAQLNALAYAQGTDIHVASGQEQHLPHEAWHVVQQAQGRVKPTMQMKDGVPVNDDAGLEHEADVMGAKATELRVAVQDDATAMVGPSAQMQSAMTGSRDDGGVAQMKWIRWATPSARKHYFDGWGAAMDIQSDAELLGVVEDEGPTDAGVQEIPFGTLTNEDKRERDTCKVVFENSTGPNGDDKTKVFHSGPTTR